MVSAGLSFYAWKINRDWQKGNQEYLRQLAQGNLRGVPAIDSAFGGWTDAARRPSTVLER